MTKDKAIEKFASVININDANVKMQTIDIVKNMIDKLHNDYNYSDEQEYVMYGKHPLYYIKAI